MTEENVGQSPQSQLERRPASDRGDGALRFLQRGTWLTLGGTVAGNAAPLLVFVLARAFAPEVFGLYVSLQLMVLTVSKAATFGLDRGLTWFVARHQQDPKKVTDAVEASVAVAVVVSLVLVGTLATLTVSSTTELFLSPAAELAQPSDTATAMSFLVDVLGGDLPFALACFAALPSWCLMHLYAGALEGARRPGYRIYWNQSFVTAFAPAVSLCLYWMNAGRWSLPIGLVAANTLGAAVVLLAARRALPGLALRPSLHVARPLLSYSWPIGLSEVVASLRMRMDLWFVLVLGGPKLAGIFAIMSTLPNGVRKIRQTYEPMVITLVSGMKVADQRELRRVFSYAVHMVSSVQLAMATAIALFAEELLSLAGSAYVLQPEAIGLLLIGHLLLGTLGLAASVVLGLGNSRALLAVNSAVLLVGAGLNYWLVPRYGLLGAALASALTGATLSAAVVAVQVQLTGTWLFSARLWTNFALGLGVALSITWQGMQEHWIWYERGALAAGWLMVLGLHLKYNAGRLRRVVH